jgi:hypothetical protein
MGALGHWSTYETRLALVYAKHFWSRRRRIAESDTWVVEWPLRDPVQVVMEALASQGHSLI